MADNYDVIICGAGSGGGFLAGEVAEHGSTLILDAGPWFSAEAKPGVGVPERRKVATQMNLGMWLPDSKDQPNGRLFFAYPMYMDQSNPFAATAQREAKV